MLSQVTGLVFGYLVDRVADNGRPKVNHQEELLKERIKFLEGMQEKVSTRPAVRTVAVVAPKAGAVDTDPTDACTVCALKHLSRASGFLNEASQMLASYEFTDPSIQTRVDTAAENLGLLEDHDWADAKVSTSPPADQALVDQFAGRVRALRKEILMCGNPDKLKTLAGETRRLSTEYRTEFLKQRGLDFGGGKEADDHVPA